MPQDTIMFTEIVFLHNEFKRDEIYKGVHLFFMPHVAVGGF